MREHLDIPAERVMPPLEAILKGQGIPSNTPVNKRTADLAREAVSALAHLAKPAGIVMEISSNEFQPVYRGLGNNAEITPFNEISRLAHSFALFAVTLGEPVGVEIRRLFDTGEYAEGTMLDSAASEAAEILATQAEQFFRDYLVKSGRLTASQCVMQFSPGYCGWHISAQAALFKAMNPAEIGITLNESYLMSPLKSITGIIFSGDREIFEFEDNFEFCAQCRTRSCLNRMKTIKEQ